LPGHACNEKEDGHASGHEVLARLEGLRGCADEHAQQGEQQHLFAVAHSLHLQSDDSHTSVQLR
jgi:hypothetical protein